MNVSASFHGLALGHQKINDVFGMRILQLDDGSRIGVPEAMTPHGGLADIPQGARVQASYRELAMPGCPTIGYYDVAAL